MSQTYTQAYYPEVYIYLRKLYPCSAPYVVYKTGNGAYKFKLSNDREQRPKPSEPLWKYPTAQAKQTTTIGRGASEICYSQLLSQWCSGKYVPYRVERELLRVPGNQNYGTAPFPDTSMDLRNKIKDYTVNLGTSLAEYRQSVTMFKRFAKGTYNAWRAFRGKFPRRARITPCSVPAAELIYSYGVSPLMSDTYDSIEALRLADLKPLVKRIVVTKSEFDEDHDYTSLRALGHEDREWWYDVSHRAIVYVGWDSGYLNTSGFTLGNPLEIAWELVPFSFVMDWGIPIGSYLSSLDALVGISFVTGTETRKTKYHAKVKQYHLNYDGSVCTIGPMYRSYRSHERVILSGIPIPDFPGWDPSRSWRAVMNGLSLLGALNKRCK